MIELSVGEIKSIKLSFRQSLIYRRASLYEKIRYIDWYHIVGEKDDYLSFLKRSTRAKIGHITRKLK